MKLNLAMIFSLVSSVCFKYRITSLYHCSNQMLNELFLSMYDIDKIKFFVRMDLDTPLC